MRSTPSPNYTTAAGLVLVLLAFLWAQHDDTQAAEAEANAPAASAAQAHRDLTAQRACEPGATAVWIDRRTVECLRERP